MFSTLTAVIVQKAALANNLGSLANALAWSAFKEQLPLEEQHKSDGSLNQSFISQYLLYSFIGPVWGGDELSGQWGLRLPLQQSQKLL